MAVPEQTPYSEHAGNGSTTSFALGFQCETKDHLIVLVDDIEPPIATWSLIDGNVVFTTAPAAGKKITVQRNTPFSRTTDYQSYNNSFRPPAVNKDFDWIWWKLQELGVADWILGNRIDALKNYVDDRDDELRAYLMEEIRKQGVALDQLDEYYNYLMQRLAQIAVDKGWDASFVVDGVQTQKEINLFGGKKYDMPVGGYPVGGLVILDNGDRVKSTVENNTVNPNVDMTGWINPLLEIVQIVPSLEGVKNARVIDDGQIIYMKSWHLGRKTGGHKWVFDSTSTAAENDVTVVASRNTAVGRWLAVFEEEKVLPMSWGGVLADNSTDNTVAVQRVFDVQQADWTVRFDNGTTLINGSPTVKAYSARVVGYNKWSTVVKFPTVGNLRGFNFTSIGGTDFRDLTLAGSGVYENMTLVYDDRQSIGIKIADVDISFLRCVFMAADTVTKCFGRGVNFYDCFAFDLRTAWLEADFPDPFQPGNPNNQTLETGFRGFIFKNNRSHYCPAVLMRNFGYNRSNIQGITIDNNELEGAGKIFAGVLRDAQITNNHSWMKDSGYKTFELIDAIDVLYSGNVNRATTGFYMGEFMTVNNSLKNVVISGNIFDGLNSDLVRVYGSNEMTDLKIFDNSYANLTTSACILNHSGGVLNNLYIKERLVAPSATWLPVKRSPGLASNYRDIDIVASGSPYVHNFARNLNCRDMKKMGTYTGTGETLSQNILIGYQANYIRIRGADGTTSILINGNNAMANGAAFTNDGFSATAAANKAQLYFWESE